MNGIVLVGSGPSLTREDVAAVGAIPTFAFNRSYLVFEEWGFSPHHYAALDPVMVAGVATDVETKILPRVQTTVFLERESGARLSAYSNVKLVSYQRGGIPRVSLDQIADCGTVGASSLQLAGALGYKKIVLIGMDAAYAQGAAARSTNHFHPAYSDGIVAEQYPTGDFVVRGWDGVARLCAEVGIEVRNASRRSALGHFPRVSLEEGLQWLRG